MRVPHDAAFRLAAEPEQDEVVPRENGAHKLGDHRVVIATMPGKIGLPLLRRQMRFSRISSLIEPVGHPLFWEPRSRAQLAERSRKFVYATHPQSPLRKIS